MRGDLQCRVLPQRERSLPGGALYVLPQWRRLQRPVLRRGRAVRGGAMRGAADDSGSAPAHHPGAPAGAVRGLGATCAAASECCSGNCFNAVCAEFQTSCGGESCGFDAEGCCGATCCGPPATTCCGSDMCCL